MTTLNLSSLRPIECSSFSKELVHWKLTSLWAKLCHRDLISTQQQTQSWRNPEKVHDLDIEIQKSEQSYNQRTIIIDLLLLSYNREIKVLVFFQKALYWQTDLDIHNFASFVNNARILQKFYRENLFDVDMICTCHKP
jgi:hypothetical protein